MFNSLQRSEVEERTSKRVRC